MKISSPNQKCNDTKVLMEENSILMNDREKSGQGKSSVVGFLYRWQIEVLLGNPSSPHTGPFHCINIS